jgi:hypothetical protein
MSLEKEIKERIQRQANGHKSRNLQNYTLQQKDYPFGKRIYAIPKDNDVYREVQDSRGLNSGPDATVESIINTMKKEITLVEADNVRLDELIELNKQHKIFDSEKGLFEIGFRSPKVIECVGKKYFKFARGCDISRISVEACKRLDYDVKEVNISNEEFSLDVNDIKLIVCYHVLEHVSSPLNTLKVIYEQVEKNTFMHIEVPIEPGMPRLSYAHMHEFQKKDLNKMLELSGWKILSHSHKTHSDGPFIDRCLVVKN